MNKANNFSKTLGVKQIQIDEKCTVHNVNKIKVIGGRYKMDPYCPICEQEKQQKELDQLSKRVIEQEYKNYLKNYSIINRRSALSYTFANFEVQSHSKEATLLMQTRRVAGEYYQDKDKSFNTLLFGNAGTGKTHLAMAILNAVNDNSNPWQKCLFLSVSGLMQAQKNYFSDPANNLWSSKYTEHVVKDADLVVFDDLGSESAISQASNFVQETIFDIYEWNQRIITTTNLSLNELKRKYEPRIVSRILEGGKGRLIDFTQIQDKRPFK